MKAFIGRKRLETYRGLLIKADLGLHAQIAEQVRAAVPAGGTVLDLGAGEGALSARLADLGFRVTAADKDAAAFQGAPAALAAVAFTQVDFDRPEDVERYVAAHAGHFDAVLGVEVIEHVHDRWQYVRQLMRMARPGGLVLVTTPNTTSWLSRIQFLLTGRFHQFGDADLAYGHVNPVTPAELALVLRESGAEAIALRPAGTLPPLYLTGLNKLALLSVLALLLRPFQRASAPGLLDGWCVMATARKPADATLAGRG